MYEFVIDRDFTTVHVGATSLENKKTVVRQLSSVYGLKRDYSEHYELYASPDKRVYLSFRKVGQFRNAR